MNDTFFEFQAIFDILFLVEDFQKKAILETLLFVAGEPAEVGIIMKATEMHESEIKRLMNELMSDYKEKNSGILIAEIAEGYQMVTNPDFAIWVKKFKNINRATRLSQSAFETLAIAAYKQPITRLEVDQLRGVNSDGVVKGLVDKRLIKITGKRRLPGGHFCIAQQKGFCDTLALKT
ncbi:SMC-Scp complex subunit ScpB [Thermodesulfovibrionales bacterium]|nr:SMC-Scp complex subunit ScpB [Thermodesulfovibrionales bacterium]